MEILKLDWDSNFFGINCGKIILEDKLTNADKDLFINHDFDFISIVNKNADTDNAKFLGEHTNTFLIDTNIQFGKPLRSDLMVDGQVEICNNFSGHEKVLEIIDFADSKFVKDPNFNRINGNLVYEHWLKNAFNKEDKYFAILKEADVIQGYVLFSFKEDTCIIELIAVDAKITGKGLGARLFQSVEAFAYSLYKTKIQVGTQLNNLNALNFYIKMGCKIIETNQVFHIWKSNSDI